MKDKFILRAVTVIFCFTLILLPVLEPFTVNAALESEKDTQSIRSVSVKDANIDNASLVIGSYIIHINGMSDEIYKMAEASANEFNQTKRYYKSELAGGKWFDVTSAASLVDITTGGVAVDKKEIERLAFTHKVSATGVITDLRYGYSVSAFDITVPYSMLDLAELENLYIQYQLLEQKKGKTYSDHLNMLNMQVFFSKSIRTANTDRYDNMITGLERYKNQLANRGKSSAWATEVHKVMEHVDALRRVEAYTMLAEHLNDLLDTLSGQPDGTEEEESEQFYVNSELVTAVGQAINGVENSILENSSKLITEGTTADSKARYQYSNDLMKAVTHTVRAYDYDNLPWHVKWYSIWIKVRATTYVGYNEAKCDTATQKLVDMSNIANGTVVDINAELETLHALAEGALAEYKSRLAKGVGETYQKAVIENNTESIKKKHLVDQKTETNAARLEYQNILASCFERMSKQDTQKYIENLISQIPALEALVPDDAVKNYHLETVVEHREWLKQVMASEKVFSSDSTDMDALKNELAELENQRQKALDQNNLAKEREISAQMEAKQKDIDTLTKSLVNILASPNSSEADKARALAQLGEGNAVKVIHELASEIASTIRNGEIEEDEKEKLVNDLVALEALGAINGINAEAAEEAIKQIEDSLTNSSIVDEALSAELVQSVIDAKEQIKLHQLENPADADMDMLENILYRILGCSPKDATAIEYGASVIALSRFGQTYNNEVAKKLASSYVSNMYANNNIYSYKQFSDRFYEYVSLKALADVLGYRYIFDNVHCVVTLCKGSIYKTYTKDSEQYTYSSNKKASMTKPVVYMENLFISEQDAKAQYKVEAEYIHDSKYAIVVTPQMEAKAIEIYNRIVESFQ